MGHSKKNEVRLLKKLVKAQAKLLECYRIGKPRPPQWVFTAFDNARVFYGVTNVANIPDE
jgi:hypothetical protein